MVTHNFPDGKYKFLQESPSTKTFSSKSFVWAPARLFFLLEKHSCAVRFLRAMRRHFARGYIIKITHLK
jgi:hypothetical protein